ncbi:MAG: lycopene cyclase [Sphingomonas bacterium]|uniref:lycopene beta-cyclase CrtY n=1 Tax=Sphingomonas bacterium TaxID=1895847 RepID=UPI002628CCBA|nr:lycopene beta-cyclase CrtY [Sphingomonas bacterium]MDB5697131.1 lycopene cyclase [Sphingomonas bacterium]
MATTITCDVAIVGGGLSGGLLALALRGKHPALDVRLVEAGDRVGGNHVWSFFGTDIADADRWLLSRLISHAWPGYDVSFPAHVRTIGQPYYSIESERLDAAVRAALPDDALMLGARVLAVSPAAVTLASGERIEATGVIDARGTADLSHFELGWQKFLGRELRLEAPHGRERPMIMDAKVPQLDGFRFVYSLPFAPDRMFVEDTYFSEYGKLSAATLRKRVDGYAAAQGWTIAECLREEQGVLPITMGGDFQAYWNSGGRGVAKIGMRAGLFQPATGYSLPDAVRSAVRLAARRDFESAALHEATHAHAARTWRERRFYRMLNAMLFRAADAPERYRVIERFYRMRPNLVRRFYAGSSTLADKARILTGKPPVAVGRALMAIRGVS